MKISYKSLGLYLLLVCTLCFTLTSCDKYNGEGSVLIKLVYNNKPVETGVVYIKYDTSGISNPGSMEYNIQQVIDAKGEVYFNNLPEGIHFVYAIGYNNEANADVHGQAILTIVKRYANNGQTLTINTAQ